MIIEYKGFNNNWIYEEAETITVARINIDLVENAENKTLEKIEELYEKIKKVIIENTHCNENITFLIGDTELSQLKNVLVVMLDDTNKHKTYVFNVDRPVYLLNSTGKTIQKF